LREIIRIIGFMRAILDKAAQLHAVSLKYGAQGCAKSFGAWDGISFVRRHTDLKLNYL